MGNDLVTCRQAIKHPRIQQSPPQHASDHAPRELLDVADSELHVALADDDGVGPAAPLDRLVAEVDEEGDTGLALLARCREVAARLGEGRVSQVDALILEE